MNQNLNLYKIFYEVAKSKTITEASKKIFISQPAISKSLKKLEDSLGVILLYRTLNGIMLTPKGEELYYYIEQAFNNLRLAEKKMNETKDLEKGTLCIGAPSNIVSMFLIEDILDFHKEFPNIDINIINRSSTEMLSLLDKNMIDIVIDTSSPKDNLECFKVKKLMNLSYCFVSKKDKFNLKKTSKYNIRDLIEYPLILPTFNSSHRQNLNKIVENNNATFKNVISMETSEMIYNMVKKGLGIGYLLYDTVKDDIDLGSLNLIKTIEKLPVVDLNLVYKDKHLTEASLKFINDYLFKRIEELNK